MILNEFFNLPQVFEKDMNEFDASGYDRYSIYMDDYDLKEKFSDLDDAVDAIEAYKRDDPKSRYADYNVRDLDGKVVWRNDAWQDVPKPGKIQFLPRNDQDVEEGMFGSKPNPVLPIVAKIDKVARELTPQNVEVGKQIIQANARDITRILSPQSKAGVDVIEQGMAEGDFTISDDPSANAKLLFLKTINGNEYRLVKQGNDVYKIYVNRSTKNKQVFPSFDLAKKALQQLLLNAVHTHEQGVAEGAEQKYLWHGSRQKIPMLEPRQSVDTGGATGSNQNAIYATSDPKVAIAMGLTTPGSDTGMFPNDPQMVLFKGNIRKGENVYLHKVPFNGPDGKPQFVQGGNSREFHTIPGVKGIKPVEIKAVPVDKYLNLIRQATPADLELQKKYMKKQGMAEAKDDYVPPKEANYDDKYQAMVRRVGQKAKQQEKAKQQQPKAPVRESRLALLKQIIQS